MGAPAGTFPHLLQRGVDRGLSKGVLAEASGMLPGHLHESQVSFPDIPRKGWVSFWLEEADLLPKSVGPVSG